MVSWWHGAWCGVMMLLTAVLLSSSAPAEQRPPGAPRCTHQHCTYLAHLTDRSVDFYLYEVEGNNILIISGNLATDNSIAIICNGANVLESPALPRVESMLYVEIVLVQDCPLPTTGSLADSLATLNLTFCAPQVSNKRCELYLTKLSATPPLSAKHFTGFERMQKLKINDSPVSFECGFLTPLKNLHWLVIRNVTVSSLELEAPPSSLYSLELEVIGLKRLPEAIRSSTNLQELTIVDDNPLDAVLVPPGMRKLQLVSPATTLRLDAAPTLEILRLNNWVEPLPPLMTRCTRLREIRLLAPAMHALPSGWLLNCWNLEELVVINARNLITLPPKLFYIGNNVKRLALSHGALEALPAGPLDDLLELKSLELDGNKLRTIPRYLFVNYFKMSKVNLSSNDLDGSVLEALSSLVQEHTLTELDLSRNPRIGDVCDVDGYSPLRKMTGLQKLILSESGVSHICRDWREKMPRLDLLNLSNTVVSNLSLEDLQYVRDVKAEVLLLGAPVSAVGMTREDFIKVVNASRNFALVEIRAEVACDCHTYWARRALEHTFDSIRQLNCVGGGLLREVAPEDMVCGARRECTAAGLPAACECTARPDDEQARGRRLVRVHCERGSLGRVPRPAAHSARLYELRLANNHITELHADDLNDNIKGLDLRNNSLARVDEVTAARLGRVAGVLRLAGNPLECDCSAAPLLSALRARRPGSTDLHAATCRDGATLSKVLPAECVSVVAWLSGALAALSLLVLAATVYLAPRERRFFALAVLHRWGLVWRGAERGPDRLYDVFVTFTYRDEGVVREVMARLEPAYRLCVHARDWIPGVFIPAQIEDSVRESWRTMALVSQDFLDSKWALAEFREAHQQSMLEARPRLIVVLLEDPDKLDMDDELRRYVTNNLHLRWGEDWFWDKLAVLLPRPRRDAPPPRPASPHQPRLPCQLEMPAPPDPPVELPSLNNQAGTSTSASRPGSLMETTL